MSKEENLKRLKMALTNREDLIVLDNGEEWVYLKYEDNEYRGRVIKTGLELGIWSIEFLLEIINGGVKGLMIKIYE